MGVLILRQRGANPLPAAAVEDVEKHPRLQVLERSAKMLRVEGEPRDLQAVAARHPGLQVSEERSYSAVKPLRPMAQDPRDGSS